VTPAVSVEGLVERFGEVEAVRGIDFDVAPGEIFGFLGASGVGKSTTIAMTGGLTSMTTAPGKPSRGSRRGRWSCGSAS
jgi:ABC-2 type transport system ATP-binding protein